MTTDMRLGNRQERIFACIRDNMVRHGRAPTIREMCRAVGISSTSACLYHLRQLVKAGRIERDLGIPRGIVLADAITVFVGEEIVVEDIRELEDGRFAARVVAPMARVSEGMAQAA